MWIEVNGSPAFAATGGRAFDAQHPVLVLVHGGGMDHSVWAMQERALAHAGLSVLSVDLPGHGLSPGPALESIPAMADWLAALLDGVGVPQAAVAGHSMGALAALAFAARHPARARAIALLGAAAYMPVNQDLRDAALTRPQDAAAMMVEWGFSARARLGGGAMPGLWQPGLIMRLLLRTPASVLAADLAACNAYESGAEDAARVACPVLVIAGARDRMCLARTSCELAALLPYGRIEVLADTGHMVMTERPHEVRDLLLAL